jgi:hypothetical protein
VALAWRCERSPLNVMAVMLFGMWLVDTIGLTPRAYPGYQWYVWGFIGLALRGVDMRVRGAVRKPEAETAADGGAPDETPPGGAPPGGVPPGRKPPAAAPRPASTSPSRPRTPQTAPRTEPRPAPKPASRFRPNPLTAGASRLPDKPETDAAPTRRRS